MKSIPILFSTPMVQALLDNRKTQTRRLRGLDKINENPDQWSIQGYEIVKSVLFARFKNIENKTEHRVKCPYGIKGDRLWVRETWNYLNAEKVNGKYQVCYRATDEKDVTGSAYGTAAKWRPSIHMPRWASRITLKSTVNPRIERLQDITEGDAIAEGIVKINDYGSTGYMNYLCPEESPFDIDAVLSYERLWKFLNGEESWNNNPYVWVVEFKKVEE